jgi:glucokinase
LGGHPFWQFWPFWRQAPSSASSTFQEITAMSPIRSAPTLALDIGGSTTRVGAFPAPEMSPDFTLLARFPTEPAYQDQLARIAAVLDQAPAHAGIGVSFGGRITRDGMAVAVAPNLPDYAGKPLARDLAARAGDPVRLAHDPVCGLLAEKRFGSLAAAERCAYLTVSTGTGAALQLGRDDVALTVSIEIGHQILQVAPGEGRPCLCGQTGCLETYTGGRQLTLRYGRPLEQIADAGVWEELERMLALGLVNLAQLGRVEVVTLGGAIALHRSGLVAEVQRQVNERIRGATLRLEPALLGEQAPLVGAALLLTTPEGHILH